MAFALKLITGPAVEPITLAQAKEHLLTNHDESDLDIEVKIVESRKCAETECGRSFITQTWKMWLDRFPFGVNPIYLPMPPVQSVTAVKYYDGNGTLQTMSSSLYYTALNGEAPRIVPVNSWPDTQVRRPEAVEVEYVAGYGSQRPAIPADIVAAIKLILAHRFRNRGDEGPIADPTQTAAIPVAAKRILTNYRAPDACIQRADY